MVYDEMWEAAGLQPRGLICLACLSDRLGRELRFGDFTPAPVNSWLVDEPISRAVIALGRRRQALVCRVDVCRALGLVNPGLGQMMTWLPPARG